MKKMFSKVLNGLFLNELTCCRSTTVKEILRSRCFPIDFANFQEHVFCRIIENDCF